MKIFVFMIVLLAAAYLPIRRGVGDALRRQLGAVPFCGAAMIYLVGTITPWPPLILVVAFLIPFVAPGNRVDVACRYVVMMPLMPSVNPTLMAGSHVIGQFSPLDLFGIGTILASLAASDRPKERHLSGFTPEDFTVLVFIVIFGVAGPRFADGSALIRNIINYVVALGVPFWIVRRNIRTRDELFLMLGCLGISAALIVVMAFYERHAGWALFDGMAYRLAPADFYARTASVRGGALRSTVTMGSPLELGLVMAMSALALYSTRELHRSRLIWGGTLVLTLLGMVASQSRGALLATAVAALVVLLVQRRYWHGVAVLSGVAALYGLLLLLARSSMRVAALIGAKQNYGGYRDYRTLLLERGLQEGRKHPVFGMSFDHVRERLADLTQGEHIIDFVNSYLHIFLISGLAGLGLCLLSFVLVYFTLARRAARQVASSAERTRACCVAGLTAILVSLFTMSFFGRGPLLLMVMLATARIIRLTNPKRDPVPTPATIDGVPRDLPLPLAAARAV